MGKTKKEEVNSEGLTTEEQIAKLKANIKQLKELGSFKVMYRELRVKSVGIMRDTGLSQQDKKEALATLCLNVADDFKGGNNE